MMHGTMNWIGHGWGIHGFGSLTGLIILILAALGIMYIIQETTQDKEKEE